MASARDHAAGPAGPRDHRHSSQAQLRAALAAGDPLALAEVYHRTSAAAHAVAQRLVGADEAEDVIVEAFAALWHDPPNQAPLEAWVRNATFAAGRERLRAAGRPAASPSANLLLREAPEVPPGEEDVERAINDLDDETLRALLLAHDRGIPAGEQRHDAAPEDLVRALLALSAEDDDLAGACDGSDHLGDWVLGLLDDGDADDAERVAAGRPCADLVRALRRGRRRLQGLPPASDLGQRVIARVLSAAPAPVTPPPTAEPPAAATGVDERSATGPGAVPAPAAAAEEAGLEAPASALETSLPATTPSEQRSVTAEMSASDAVGEEPEPPPEPEAPLDPGVPGLTEAPVEPGMPPEPEAPPEPEPPVAPDEAGDERTAPPAAEPEPAVPGSGYAADAASAGWARTGSAPDRSTQPGAGGDRSGELTWAHGPDAAPQPTRSRVATVFLTIVGALLLFAAGGVLALLALRFFLG